ncbi:MAG: hypothetical protein AcusKO_49120 [Acuticoccus sp.]
MGHEPRVATSRPVGDRVAQTTCYMCACRCGIDVHLRDGPDGTPRVRYIEGNRDHPVNKGVLCGKGSAGIMQHYSPARLRAPLRRTGPRGSGEFEEISWDEALTLATGWLGDVRCRDPKRLAFFTGRDQSQSLTGFWAMKYGTPNFAAHGGFCSVNMAAGGLYTFGGAFWEFGDPDWALTKYFMLFGVAEDHASNPLKIGLGKLKTRGARVVAVNPVRTGYNAIADEWVGIRPGTDGLFVGALIHELFTNRTVDLDYLVRYTNAPWLVIEDPGAADHGLFARDADGNPLIFDTATDRLVSGLSPDARALVGARTLADGRAARPSSCCWPSASSRRVRARARRAGDRHRGGRHPPHRRRACRGGIRTGGRAGAAVDRLGRPPARQDDRPPRLHARHARHLGPFQRLPDLPDDPHPADPAGLDRLPRGFRYKPPYPKQAPPWLLAARKHCARRAPAGAAGRPAPRLPPRPRASPARRRCAEPALDKGFSWDAPRPRTA